MDASKLESIKQNIEQMTKHQHIEILKMLKKNPSITLNENKSGVYINLAFLPESVIDELTEYIHYVQDQEKSFMPLETQKNEFKNSFFSEKGVKDEATILYSSLAKPLCQPI